MNRIHGTLGALGAATALIVPALFFGAGAASAADGPEKHRHFTCAGAKVDFNVEKENGRFDVDADLDGARRGSQWRIVLKHDGKRIHRAEHRADRDGDIEVTRSRRDTAGKDVFRLRVTPVGGRTCSARIVMR